tara:strand:+ start:288 stop:602 length:315 start_codon:yes stop_codon:yes gene_type:complete
MTKLQKESGLEKRFNAEKWLDTVTALPLIEDSMAMATQRRTHMKCKWTGYGYPKVEKRSMISKMNDTIWAPFDKDDPLEWILIGFGIGAVVILTLVGVYEWISQ